MEQIKRTLRRWAQKSHTWVGIVAGLLFCLMGLSGAVIAFRPQIESAHGPKAAPVVACPVFDPDQAVAAVNGFVHGVAVDRISFPAETGDPFVFQLRKPGSLRIAYDHCFNRVLGIRNIAWLDWLVDLHHNLLAGKTGRRVVGAIGVALLFSSLSGLLVWVTAHRRRGVTIDSRASRRRIIYDLHRSAGLLASLVLIVQASTGIGLAYPELLHSLRDGSNQTTSARKQQKTEKKAHKRAKAASLTEAIRIAQLALPDGRIREVRGLGGDAKRIEVRFWRPGDVRKSGNNFVYLNAAGTTVLSVVKSADQSAGNHLSELFAAIHYGEWGGLGSRILLAFAGITLAFLFASGFLVRWWPKSNRRRVPSQIEQSELVAVSPSP
jgi:uncharacterized iron-regulated membrane protein